MMLQREALCFISSLVKNVLFLCALVFGPHSSLVRFEAHSGGKLCLVLET